MLQSGTARRDADAAERLRSVRERLEATESGLGELDLLRQRQEILVRTALDLQQEEEEEEGRREAQLSSEEKVLEENILLLRKQLNCLRRRDSGLLSQLQDLDRQISDLRLDTEESRDPPETDSRPSSGFYELSDGASGSLSNSSNSVFSECFCPGADGRLPPADELSSCLDCDGLVGGLCDDSSFCGTVRRSLSATQPPTLDSVSLVVSCDSQVSKYHCDLVVRSGSEVYRYPSPLHAVAVQSPVFLQKWGHGSHSREEGVLKSLESFPLPVSAPSVPQSSSWPAPSSSSSSSSSSSLTPSQKRLDSYIFSLLQRRALPIRTNKPRTSISTDPSKSILRQGSLCVRQFSDPSSWSGFGTVRGSDLRPSWPAAGAESAMTWSPHSQWSGGSKSEEQDSPGVYPDGSIDAMQHGFKVTLSDPTPDPNPSPLKNSVQTGSPAKNQDSNPSTHSLLKQKGSRLLRELGCPTASSSPKETKTPCYPPDQDLPLKPLPTVKPQPAAPRDTPKPPQTEKSVPDKTSEGSSHSQDPPGGGGLMVDAKLIRHQRQIIKPCKSGNKILKSLKVKNATLRMSPDPGLNERRGDKSYHRSSSKRSRLLEDGGSIHVRCSRRAAGGANGTSSSRMRRLPASIPEGRVLDQHTTSTGSSVQSASSRNHPHGHHPHGHHHHGHHHHGHHHHHHHGRDQVVVLAKSKYKRSDYWRLRAIMEVPCDEAFRRAQQRKKKELLSHSAANGFLPSQALSSSPYAACTAGSDSEYSAECASLFHSTIVDTSEDERSNYTTNRFGDSESSEDEYVEESTTTSDTEESGGGGAGGGAGGTGRGWGQSEAAGAPVTGKAKTAAQAKAFIKIKASHNLKRRILRFRSGSLKLMTTV